MNKNVITFLKKDNYIEKKQLINNEFINDIPLNAIDISTTKGTPILAANDYFFKHHLVFISKHNRYASYPKHSHKFLEINYMLEGSCHQIVAGHEIFLKKGDILMMNIGCTHSISALGENDILINLLFRDKNITFKLLSEIHKSNSLTYDFLTNISLGKQAIKNYIIFPHNTDIQSTMNQIIEEYFLDKPYANNIVESYLTILLTKILRHHPMPTTEIHNNKQKLVLNILKDISENYKKLNLTDLSQKYGYNKNYLGNLITDITGTSFTKLRTQQRMIQANNLIQSTTLPIDKIMETVGISNKNFFYKKYKEKYNQLPGKKRSISILSKNNYK